MTVKVLCIAVMTLLGWCMRKSRPMTGSATLKMLILRKVLAFTSAAGIRLATTISGIELRKVLVTLAMRPAVFGLSAVTYMLIPLSVCVQLTVVSVVFRLRCISMRCSWSLMSVLQIGTTVLFGQLNRALMFLLLSVWTSYVVLESWAFPWTSLLVTVVLFCGLGGPGVPCGCGGWCCWMICAELWYLCL